MGFGTSVAALLDTYSQCLNLLKIFKRKNERTSRDEDGDRQSLLRRSLRSDRAKIERSYSSRLSERGAKLAKGDAHAKSALGRILKKLKAAIHNLLHSSSSNQHLDFESLMALSNSSRIDAISTIDQLSQRLGSSRSSVASVASKGSSPSRHKRHHSSSSVASSKGSEARLRKSSRETSKEGKPKSSQKLTKGESKPLGSPKSDRRTHSRSTSGASTSRAQNRLSMATISSDSTRLGEVPEGKRRLRYMATDSSSEEYNITAVYPLRPYYPPQPEVKEKRFWGLFRRRSGEFSVCIFTLDLRPGLEHIQGSSGQAIFYV
ncbi:hypothetical protein GQ53DRAFT_809130 [Thozetella sp. PMI_491]|nr:hypothetical protein GQ53DRAFT_809130 [Thozetella sp. PMI_491]